MQNKSAILLFSAFLTACAVGAPTLPQCAKVSTSYGDFIVCAYDGDSGPTLALDAGALDAISDASAEAAVEASAEAAVEAGVGAKDAAGADVREAGADVREASVDAKADVVVDASPPPAQDGAVAQRPSGNTGTGFFVSGGKLFDANGNEFRVRGVNHLHFDSPSIGIPKSGANTERWVLSNTASTDGALAAKSAQNKMVPIVGNWDGTCDESTATLTGIVDRWVSQAATWKARERDTMINIANEWGPANSTVWRDQYIAAVQRLRSAGLNHTIVVDSGGCGQDRDDIVNFGAAIEAADPQHNVLFDVHLYGFWCTSGCESWQFPLTSSLDSLRATGLPVIVGEFGPGRNIGPSATMMTPAQVISAAETRGFGWIAWAWDDPAGEFTSQPTDDWFALSFTGDYRSSADLTTFGKSVVEDPVTGLKALARKASIFQ